MVLCSLSAIVWVEVSNEHRTGGLVFFKQLAQSSENLILCIELPTLRPFHLILNPVPALATCRQNASNAKQRTHSLMRSVMLTILTLRGTRLARASQ